MILLQLSSGRGPAECRRAVALAYATLLKQAQRAHITVNTLETVASAEANTFYSVLVQLSPSNQRSQTVTAPHNQYRNQNHDNSTLLFAQQWQGAMLWINESPFRSGYKRKNWFFSGQLFQLPTQATFDSEIQYKTCRSSGAGGQHVNTTDSAVQATHRQSGITVRVEHNRSQHANKRAARLLIMHKLSLRASEQHLAHAQDRWRQHLSVQRGNPSKVFHGARFIERS